MRVSMVLFYARYAVLNQITKYSARLLRHRRALKDYGLFGGHIGPSTYPLANPGTSQN